MGSSSGADDLFGDPWASPGAAEPNPFTTSASPFDAPAGTAFDPFGTTRPSPPLRLVRPPLVWLGVAIATGIAGLVLAALSLDALGATGPIASSTIVIPVGSWALGGPITIVLTAVFQWRDTIARTNLGYARNAALTTTLYVIAIAIGLSAVVVAAATIAEWAGRQPW